MANNDQNVRIKPDTWTRLNRMKGPGDSFDDVIRRLLDEHEEVVEGNPKVAATAN